MMKFIKWLSKLDRRIIFAMMILVVLIPMLFSIPVPFEVGEPVHNAFNAIDSLPPGSVLMLSVDYDATSYPECQPMIVAVANHAFRKDLKLILLGNIPTGLPLGQEALDGAATAYGKTYGEDFVNLGFRPGGITIMVGMGREIRDFFAQDFRGTPVDSLPMMAEVHNYDDISVLVSFAHGISVEQWVAYAGARYGQQIIGGVTGVVAPDLYPYLQSGQIVGLMGGLKGASEYEALIKRKGLATRGMPAQSTAHILVIFLIVIGSISEFVVDIVEKRRRK
jgi:hypothetical protein